MKQAKVIYNKGFYIGDEVRYIEEIPLYLISKGIVRIAVDGGLAYYKKGDTPIFDTCESKIAFQV